MSNVRSASGVGVGGKRCIASEWDNARPVTQQAETVVCSDIFGRLVDSWIVGFEGDM